MSRKRHNVFVIMLEPRKTTYRKQQKGTGGGKQHLGTTLAFGNYGLRAIETGPISQRQIEAVRQSLARFVKRSGRIWIRIFPSRPVTFKGIEVAMGGGKGDVIGYEAPVSKGRILFEMDGIPEGEAKVALRIASHKLPLKTRFVKRIV